MTTIHPAAVEFIERISLLAESAGIPRIGGRILGLLVVETSPLSCEGLASRLKVSRGSISANTRFLESRGVIRRVCHLDERKDLFEIDPCFPERLVERHLDEQRAMLRLAMETNGRLPARFARAKETLRRIAAFSKIAVESTETMLRQWRAAGEPRDGAPDA